MSLPSPSLSVPGLSNDQLSFQGVTLGPGSPWLLTKLEGLEKPEVRSGNTDRPRTRGSFVGLNLLKSRTITATLDVGPFGAVTNGGWGSYQNVQGALAALRPALSTEGATEYPLWLQLPNLPLVACMARVLKASVPYDYTAERGLVQGASIQWEASDPYLYSAPTLNPQVGLPTPGAGFSFPLTFNWSFGGSSNPNQVTVTNSGNVTCWPTLVITGPCLNPSVSNQSVTGNPTITLGIQLNAGDQIFVDCDYGSITFFPSGSSVGSPYPQILQAGSTFFGLVPGANTISFNDQSTSQASGTLNVWNASAYSGLL